MYSQKQVTQKCAECNYTEFYVEDGHYYCRRCQTQDENAIEQTHEIKVSATMRTRKFKIKSDQSKSENDDEQNGWTTWELYNFVLIGLADELSELSNNKNIKLTILQIWSYYLSKLEVAFTSKKVKERPRVGYSAFTKHYKRDTEIIYGKIKSTKRKRSRSLSTMSRHSVKSEKSIKSELDQSIGQSDRTNNRKLSKIKKEMIEEHYKNYLTQSGSDSDGMNLTSYASSDASSKISQISRLCYSKRTKLQIRQMNKQAKKIPYSKRKKFKAKRLSVYRSGPDAITPNKIFAIVYLALRLQNENIYLSDILRFAREGHLSLYKLDQLIPQEVDLKKSDLNFLNFLKEDITHSGVRKNAAVLAKFLNISEIAKPNFIVLFKRYCEDLNLPRGFYLYVERLYLLCPSIMKFNEKSHFIPNYEGRAMAYIVVVFKILFGLDDLTEKEISRVAEKLNEISSKKQNSSDLQLFSFCEWQKYIECCEVILSHLHFPSKMKYNIESSGNSHLYTKFFTTIQTKIVRDVEVDTKTVLPQELVFTLTNCLENLNINEDFPNDTEWFTPHFTPLTSYISQIALNSNYKLPDIAKLDFYHRKLGYLTNLNAVKELARDCGVKLSIIDSNLRYLEKIVPNYVTPKIVKENFIRPVKIYTPVEGDKLHKSENFVDFLHKYRTCEIQLNQATLQLYKSTNKNSDPDRNLLTDNENNFDKILSDGRLDILSGLEDDFSTSSFKNDENDLNVTKDLLKNDLCMKYNIQLHNHEIFSLENDKKIRKEKVWNIKTKKRSKKKVQKDDEISSSESNSSKHSYVELNSDVEDFDVQEIPAVENFFDLHDSDISILNDEVDDVTPNTSENLEDLETLFRPFKNYWIYRCGFNLAMGNYFDLVQKELPLNYQWLLKVCANVVEMTVQELYEEVRMVETFLLNNLDCKDAKEIPSFFRTSFKSIKDKW